MCCTNLIINLKLYLYTYVKHLKIQDLLYLFGWPSNQHPNALGLCCRPSIKIPVSVMMPVAHVVEWTYKTFCKYGMKVPQLTPSRIRLLSCNRTFSCSRAKDQLGYEPIVSVKVFTVSCSFTNELAWLDVFSCGMVWTSISAHFLLLSSESSL
jgi:hypothetical protein